MGVEQPRTPEKQKMSAPYYYPLQGPTGEPCPTCGLELEATDEVREGKVWECVCENDHEFQAIACGGGDWEIV